MKKRINNSGFAMIETLIVAVAVVTILSIVYSLIYPLIGNYEGTANYEDLDTKYVAFYIKEMIETDVSVNKVSNNALQLCNGNCSPYRTLTKKCAVDANNVCTTNNNGEIIFTEVDNIFTTDTHYVNENELCNQLDSDKLSKNNKYICNRYVRGAKITNIFMTKYDTRGFKQFIKNNEYIDNNHKITRSLKEYVEYLPTHVGASNDKKNNYNLLIVEVEHDSYNTYSDKYYTYASIEVKK